eukprot:SAG11_NODE_871_length_6811_cov_5.422229_1_plen_460_part_00
MMTVAPRATPTTFEMESAAPFPSLLGLQSDQVLMKQQPQQPPPLSPQTSHGSVGIAEVGSIADANSSNNTTAQSAPPERVVRTRSTRSSQLSDALRSLSVEVERERMLLGASGRVLPGESSRAEGSMDWRALHGQRKQEWQFAASVRDSNLTGRMKPLPLSVGEKVEEDEAAEAGDAGDAEEAVDVEAEEAVEAAEVATVIEAEVTAKEAEVAKVIEAEVTAKEAEVTQVETNVQAQAKGRVEAQIVATKPIAQRSRFDTGHRNRAPTADALADIDGILGAVTGQANESSVGGVSKAESPHLQRLRFDTGHRNRAPTADALADIDGILGSVTRDHRLGPGTMLTAGPVEPVRRLPLALERIDVHASDSISAIERLEGNRSPIVRAAASVERIRQSPSGSPRGAGATDMKSSLSTNERMAHVEGSDEDGDVEEERLPADADTYPDAFELATRWKRQAQNL